MPYEELDRRKQVTDNHWRMLATASKWESSAIADVAAKVCVYVTGSLARNEASEESDMDLFVVDSLTPDSKQLSPIEQARLLAWLDKVRDAAHFRPFSRGGYFLKVHSFQAMVAGIGDASDDAENAFTARMLLLMNSRCLLNPDEYSRLRREALDAYWYEFSAKNEAPVVTDPDRRRFPVMLTNDLRRWWGVVALNFERDHRIEKAASPLDRVNRRIANLKLRYARMVGIYSVLMHMVALSDADGLTRHEVQKVLDLTPVDRLRAVAQLQPYQKPRTEGILEYYDSYLRVMRGDHEVLLRAFGDDDGYREIKKMAYEFHRRFTELFVEIGREKPLFNYCII